MAYHFTHFNETEIPAYMPQQDHSPVRALATIVPTLGGYYDHRGARAANPQMQSIVARGTVVGELEYWVDETDDPMVDESGDYLIWGNAIQMLRTQVDELAKWVLERGTLWRRRQDDEERQWKTVRFANMSFQQERNDLFHAQLTCTFETRMAYWHAETLTTVSGNATSGTPLTLTVENDGQRTISDAVLRVVGSSGTIILITIVCESVGVDLAWSGSLTSGEELVLDCGESAIPDGVDDAFDGLVMDTEHSAAGWLLLPVPTSDYVITVSGGNAVVSIEYYKQFA